MKAAFLLSRTPHLFNEIYAHFQNTIQTSGSTLTGSLPKSIRLEVNGDMSFVLYDRETIPSFLEKYEIPSEALMAGYRYGYMVECRSEVHFCSIIRSLPPVIDIMILDSNGTLFTPISLTPNEIIL